jgi:hypothetical protein
MTGSELYEARRALGELWGLGRALTPLELGRVLRLAGRDPGHSICDYERGRSRISGPLSVAIEMMLGGALPPDHLPDGFPRESSPQQTDIHAGQA